jgi:hypothetical protein
MKKQRYHIGIDPGVNTGIAIWDSQNKEFTLLKSFSILKAIEAIEIHLIFQEANFYIENPNKRKWFGNSGKEKLQGAGSIKRDYSIWVELFTENNIEFIELEPKHIITKLDSYAFKKITGIKTKTNQHVRDAAMMVYGK